VVAVEGHDVLKVVEVLKAEETLKEVLKACLVQISQVVPKVDSYIKLPILKRMAGYTNSYLEH
jgi:hypothetical protein